MAGKNNKMDVAEAPGLYGTLKIEEKLIQKIYLITYSMLRQKQPGITQIILTTLTIVS